jgi:hypothetical protein
VVRDWSSLHDATGPDILFVFAGENVADRLSFAGIPDQRGSTLQASDHAAVAGSGRWQNLLAQRTNRGAEPAMTYGQPKLGARHDLANDHTLEISALRRRLDIREARLPCLAYFLLNTDGYRAPSLTVPLSRVSRTGIYRYLKSLSELLEDDFRNIDRIMSQARSTRTEVDKSRASSGNLRGAIRAAAAALPSLAARDAVEEILAVTQTSMDQPGARERCYQHLRTVTADRQGPYCRAGSRDGRGALVPNLQRLIDLSLRGRITPDSDHDALVRRSHELTRAGDEAWERLDQRLRSLHGGDSGFLPEDETAAEPSPADDVETPRERNRRTLWTWVGRLASGIALTGLAVYLLSVGLENADKVAGVLGVFVALIGLVVPYLFRGRPADGAK